MRISLFAVLLTSYVSTTFGQVPNRTLIVTSILEPPFLMLKSDRGDRLTGNDRYEGYIADFLKLLTKKLGFDYLIKLVPDGKFGEIERTRDGSVRWNGMIGELVEERVDLAAGPLTLSSKRSRVVHFGTPFMKSGIGILMRKPRTATRVGGIPYFMEPFSMGVMACIVVSVIVVVICFYVISRFNPYERHSKGGKDDHNCGVVGALWLVCGGLVLQGYSKRPTSVATFILIGAWWMFCLILFATFLSGMMDTEVTPVKMGMSRNQMTVQDVVSDDRIKTLAINESNTASFICTSRISIYKEACGRLIFVNSTKQGIDKVRRYGVAFLMETPWIRYVTMRYCDLTQVGDTLHSTFYGLATPLKSTLRKGLQWAVPELREDGSLAKLEQKWWNDVGTCTDGEKTSAPQSRSWYGPVSFTDVGHLFAFLGVGILLSGVTMVIESFCFCFKKKRSSKEERPTEIADTNNTLHEKDNDQPEVVEVEPDEKM